MQLKKIGLITKTQGLKGQFRVKPSEPINNLLKIKKVYINNLGYNVTKIINRTGFLIFELGRVDDISIAEKFINKAIFIEEDLDKINNVLIMLGSEVINSCGKKIGKIIDISNYGAGDIITIVDDNGIEALFPNVRNVIINFDKCTKIVTIDENIYNEIRV